MNTIISSVVIISALFLVRMPTQAQSYSVDWDTIAGGGGMTSGGGFSTTSTIGENVAGGSLNGGGYSLGSGFWAIYATTTTGPSPLTIFLSDTNTVVISWPAVSSGTVQQTADLSTGNWNVLTDTVTVVNGLNQIVLLSPTGVRFYRLQSQ